MKIEPSARRSGTGAQVEVVRIKERNIPGTPCERSV
jgi:hypothetical protein